MHNQQVREEEVPTAKVKVTKMTKPNPKKSMSTFLEKMDIYEEEEFNEVEVPPRHRYSREPPSWYKDAVHDIVVEQYTRSRECMESARSEAALFSSLSKLKHLSKR